MRQAAATVPSDHATPRLVQFTPFDPATRMSEAIVVDRDGAQLRVVKGAFPAIAGMAETPPTASRLADELAERGQRVIAVAAGSLTALRLGGLVGLSDPPREDSATLVATLRAIGVRTVMVTGDSPLTAGVIAREVGISGPVSPTERVAHLQRVGAFGVFARVLPEEKDELVRALQGRGHVVGMCGDGVNDAPALRQAQIGIAVSSATDVAKAAAGMVLTEPGLAGVVDAVREGRIAFQRLLTYVLNMLVKKTEIVLLLALGLFLTGHAVLTPVLMVLMMLTKDILSMSLTTDRARPTSSPSVWRMPAITGVAMTLAAYKLGFSGAVLALGAFWLRLKPGVLQTLAFVTLVFGNQALLYALRERGHLWRSMPGRWVLAASAADLAIVSALAVSGTLMVAVPGRLLAAVLAAAAGFALVLDYVKLPVMARLGIR
jgi:H+-transporting ATPase